MKLCVQSIRAKFAVETHELFWYHFEIDWVTKIDFFSKKKKNVNMYITIHEI